MSPEYRVIVPRGKARAFESGLTKIKGARIAYKEGGSKSAIVQLERELEEHKLFVEDLRVQKKDEGVQKRISAGYRDLVRDLFYPNYDHKTWHENLEKWRGYFGSPYNSYPYDESQAKETLLDIFLTCTRIGPSYLHFDPKDPWRGTPILTPSEVRFIAERYGLRDGFPKSFAEIGELMNIRDKKNRIRVGKVKNIFEKILNKAKKNDLTALRGIVNPPEYISQAKAE